MVLDCFRRFNAILSWHVNIHQNKIRAKSFGFFYCFLPINCFTYNFNSFLRFEESSKNPTEVVMIICQKNF